MIRQYRNNPSLYRALRATVTYDQSQDISIQKLAARIQSTFTAHYDFLRIGPRTGDMDVINCATRLQEIVLAADRFLTSRPHNPDPANHQILRRDIAILFLRMLMEVLNRDRNAYENLTWTRSVIEGPNDKNLCLRLVGGPGYPPKTVALERFGQATAPDFVLDVLELTGPANLGDNITDMMRNVYDTLRIRRADEAYVARFRSIAHIEESDEEEDSDDDEESDGDEEDEEDDDDSDEE